MYLQRQPKNFSFLVTIIRNRASMNRNLSCRCLLLLFYIALAMCAFVNHALANSCDPAPTNIVGWWPGDGNANTLVGTNNGVLEGGATATNTGYVGQAFSFDGTNAFVEIPDAPALDPTNLTVEAWVLFHSLDSPALGGSPMGEQYIIFKQNTRSTGFEGYYIGKERGSSGDYFVFTVTSAAGQTEEVDSSTPIVTNTWYHVAAVRGSNYIQLYVNGAFIGQSAATAPQDYGTEPLFFGTSGVSSWDHKLNGRLDEVTLYNRALGSNEIAAIYAAGSFGKCKGVSPPGIVTPPTNQTVAVGSNGLFTVTASGTGPLSYQWLFDSAPITGATTNSLSLTAVQTNNAGLYSVLVTNSAGAVTSSPATLSVTTPPTSTNQSTPIIITGISVSNKAVIINFTGATNDATTSFTVLSSVTAIPASSYTSNNSAVITQRSPGGFRAVVSMNGSAQFYRIKRTASAPPAITVQPVSQTNLVGMNVSFSVTAGGAQPLGFQWYSNGVPLTDGGNIYGSSSSTLGLTGITTNDAANYQVIITNLAGSTTSSVATLTVTVPGSCVEPPSNLVGWWPGEGNAHDSASVDDGALEGGATFASGLVGQAFSFDGTNAYVEIPDAPALDPANLTLEAWVLFNSLDSAGSGGSPAGQQYIIFKQNTRSSGFEGYYLGKERGDSGDYFVFTVTSAAGQPAQVVSSPTIATNTWYHIAAVRTSTNIQLYIDGASIGQAAAAWPQDYGTLPLFFGSSGQSSWDHKLNGLLDEVSLYNRPLAASEIASIYNAGAGGKCEGEVSPTILVQPLGGTLDPGSNISLSVSVAGSAIIGYQWYKDGFKLRNVNEFSGVTTATLLVANAQSNDIGDYQVIITNAFGSATSSVASLNSGVTPPNDNFANAITLGNGSSGSVSGNNANATKEPGEPDHAGNPGGASVWYTWTAPSTSPVTFDTCMSGFDTLLAVYAGNGVSALSLVSSNNDVSTNNPRSRLTFTPVTGTTYAIAVDGANGASGNFTLRWVQASVPLPDLSLVASAVNPQISTENFSTNSCAVLEGLIQSGTRTIIRFDTETENSGTADLVFGDPADNPLFVWAPCHAHYHFNNYMSYRLRGPDGSIAATGLKVGFCVLDVFRWSSTANSTATYSCTNQGISVGWGDLYDSTLDGQWIDITGLPPGNYTMELEANPQGIIQESDYDNDTITVPITIGDPSAPPMNDLFTNAQTLLGGFDSTSGNTTNATKGPGEPNHAGNPGGASVWYQWEAPDSKPVTIDTIGSSFNTLLAVYTGTNLSNLSVVASNDDIGPGVLQSRVTFNAVANTVYDIAVDGYNGATGNLILTLDQTIQNDNFANCQFVGGVNGIVYGANVGATKEPGEPDHAGNPGGASIWYCWTAPITGTATFTTAGSSFNTLLAVYTGSSVSTLTNIASNAGGNGNSSVTFSATGLTMYHIAIDGNNGATGDTVLNWSLVASGSSPTSNVRQNIATVQPTSGSPVSAAFLAEGEYQLRISGQPSQLYVIETSCDLKHWKRGVTTLADTNGVAFFTDKTTMNAPRQSGGADPVCGAGNIVGTHGRYYRAIAAPPSARAK
jgi:hypothetical protein